VSSKFSEKLTASLFLVEVDKRICGQILYIYTRTYMNTDVDVLPLMQSSIPNIEIRSVVLEMKHFDGPV